ncbi:GNAT family N-acetyltransferase [Paenibacillus sp. SAFN-117]|uniref:GNAT family N-acetyltransferase n=1 Tax=Paenibacillus sp. SAFN-117 TaxID=3436860 RepID=UPI0012490DD6|nr:GNAT family N-acetyltransferase [Aneurinibacillus sp. XH2]
MKIRQYNDSDQEALEKFMEVMYAFRGLTFDPDHLHLDLRRIPSTYQEPGGQFWIIADNDAVIGTVGVKILDSNERIGEIKRFFVLSEYHGRGLGRELMETAINFARERNLKKIRLDTRRQAIKALSIFRKYGFYEIQRYNDNEHAEIFMELDIEAKIEG